MAITVWTTAPTPTYRQKAAEEIRRAISLIDWSGYTDDSPALNNAWASLNTALEYLNEQPLRDVEDVRAYRERSK